jgi:dihydrofolate reductase
MRPLVVYTFVTLDGVMQAPGGPDEDRSGGFNYGGWSVNYWDDDIMPSTMDAGVEKLEALLLGRKTYEIFAAYWPNVSDEPLADKFNSVPKYVASSTLQDPTWRGTTVIRDVPVEVQKLKDATGGEIQVHGSGNLVQSLLSNNLVDELRLMIFPVVIGEGKRLFAKGAIPVGLELVHSAVAASGVIVAHYRPTGDIAYGSFA